MAQEKEPQNQDQDQNEASDFQFEFAVKKDIDAFARCLDTPNEDALITAVSDWTPTRPVSQKLKRKLKTKRNDFKGIGYHVIRWPFLLLLGIWLFLLTAFYVLVRAYVALYEAIFTWRGRRRELRLQLRNANSYADWIKAAQVLDDYLRNNEWKHYPESDYYDSTTVSRYLELLRRSRKDNDKTAMLPLLQDCVRFNFAGTQGTSLYSQCYYGTKDLVADYHDEVVRDLKALTKDTQQQFPQQFNIMSKNLGRSALCLSGGACFAYRHFGVVKALLDEDLLPDIITGTSGGGLVAALVGTRTNEELRTLLYPEIIAPHITACWEKFPTWVIRWLKTGARFDAVDWAQRACWFTRGSLTFREAYERTGKILNISTVPEDPHSPVILCNHITSPDTVIWSALLASSAVPGILNPVVMMMKKYNNKNNSSSQKNENAKKDDYTLVPFRAGSKWKDGSLRTDIPIQSLNSYFNVNFTIVSQVNPHVSLFIYSPRGTVGRPSAHRNGKGWRGGFVGSALENVVKLEIIKWLKLIRNLDLLPRLKDQDWSSVWLQRFDGTVTIWPRIHLLDFWHILDDPDEDALRAMMLAGERSTYPRLLFIRHFMEMEKLVNQYLEGAKIGANLETERFQPDGSPLRRSRRLSRRRTANM